MEPAQRLFLLICALFLLMSAAPAHAHNLPMGGSKWCVGRNAINATIDLNETLFSELQGIRERRYRYASGSDQELQQIAHEFIQPYVNRKISLSVNGMAYPMTVTRLVRNDNSTFTIWLAANNVAFDKSDSLVKIDYRMLFEETKNEHVNLGYFYQSDATGDALQKYFDNSPAAGEHNFSPESHVWELDVKGVSAASAPAGLSLQRPVDERAAANPAVSHARPAVSAPAVSGRLPAAPGKGSLLSDSARQGAGAVAQTAACPKLPPGTRGKEALSQIASGVKVSQGSHLARAPSRWSNIGSFILLGIEHILTGYDHIAFLVGLIVIGLSIREVLKIITAFTIAHSITLLLAAMQVINLNSRFVESVIAISICYIALENLCKKEVKYRWLITFCFGLVHGFGFASALQDLIVGKSNLLVSVLSFNLGVETGQLMIFFFLLPVLHLLRRKMEFRQVTRAVSLAILFLGLTWLIERLFDVNLIS